MNTSLMFSSATDEWYTPIEVYNDLNKECELLRLIEVGVVDLGLGGCLGLYSLVFSKNIQLIVKMFVHFVNRVLLCIGIY